MLLLAAAVGVMRAQLLLLLLPSCLGRAKLLEGAMGRPGRGGGGAAATALCNT